MLSHCSYSLISYPSNISSWIHQFTSTRMLIFYVSTPPRILAFTFIFRFCIKFIIFKRFCFRFSSEFHCLESSCVTKIWTALQTKNGDSLHHQVVTANGSQFIWSFVSRLITNTIAFIASNIKLWPPRVDGVNYLFISFFIDPFLNGNLQCVSSVLICE